MSGWGSSPATTFRDSSASGPSSAPRDSSNRLLASDPAAGGSARSGKDSTVGLGRSGFSMRPTGSIEFDSDLARNLVVELLVEAHFSGFWIHVDQENLGSGGLDSRSNRPIEAGSGEGGVLRWDAEGEAGGGAAHRDRARRLWRWEGEM